MNEIIREEGFVKPRGFWGNTENSVANPFLHATIIMSQRGIPITIRRDATDSWGNPLRGDVAIYTTDQSQPIMKRLLHSRDLLSLCTAYDTSGLAGGFDPSTEEEPLGITESSWDEKTKIRLRALYYENVGIKWGRHADYETRSLKNEAKKMRSPLQLALIIMERNSLVEVRRVAQAYQTKAQRTLGTLPPLTIEDLGSLVAKVVEQIINPQS